MSVQNRETGYNAAGEFVLAAVDERGVLHQLSGADDDIARELVSIARSGFSIEEQRQREQRSEDERLAMERGDTPEMPRQTQWLERESRDVRVQVPPGTDMPRPFVSGQRPAEDKNEAAQ